ncbi:hypothetical protein OBBRIDRAFT_727448 [Obba rivulosa]|uniref:DASH complex subunit DAD3 n=1 Tax=Obba rivulosa TaxID=1052685 RepID=A0A8E2B1V3_9APHY|nr:hypothetical protein OBBRIDRAFT_727448 [Obba rivulosa]
MLQTNPYQGHPNLSETDAEVLWQYAKLSQNIKELIAETRRLSEAPDETLLKRLRVLEVKMGLVLTLFKASVWGVINEQSASEGSSDYVDNSADNTAR